MVVLVIVGILAIGVVFMFADPTAKVKAAAFEMRGDLNLARAEAVRRNENILVDFVFTACNKADVDDTANLCAAVCSKIVDPGKTDVEKKAGFDACYSATGTNQGYVICFDEDEDNSCDGEVSATTPAEDLEEKVIKTVLFKDAVQYYEFSGTLPSSSSGGNVPSKSPDGVD
ncbi:MAG: GspH/FimT family pseudopilin, partial [Desulfobulbales bacterium]